jgi:hypothetical protein
MLRFFTAQNAKKSSKSRARRCWWLLETLIGEARRDTNSAYTEALNC